MAGHIKNMVWLLHIFGSDVKSTRKTHCLHVKTRESALMDWYELREMNTVSIYGGGKTTTSLVMST